MSDRGGGEDSVHNIRVYPKLRVMEKLGEITSAANSENLCCPLVADGRDICL